MLYKKPTYTMIIDTRRQKTDGSYPVKLRVTYKRHSMLYGTVYSLTQDDFDKVMDNNPKLKYKEMRMRFYEIEDRAEEIINQMKVFSFGVFTERFSGRSAITNNILAAYVYEISKINREGRVGTANSYQCALNSFLKFCNRTELGFEEVDTRFLKDYEAWALHENLSLTSIGIYMRTLRAIYNQGIRDAVVEKELYPFGRGRYEIPAPQAVKDPLSTEEVKMIIAYKPTSTQQCFYRDLWLFSLFLNGANMKDVCLLKYSNIHHDKIIFRREKTIRTNRNSKPIVAGYAELLMRIVEKWGVKPPSEPIDVGQNKKENRMLNEVYIFPFIKNGDDERRIKAKVAEVVKQMNKHMDLIAKSLKIVVKVTTYTARHTFISVLSDAGMNLANIADLTGHASQKVTEGYIHSLIKPDPNRVANIFLKNKSPNTARKTSSTKQNKHSRMTKNKGNSGKDKQKMI